MKIRIVLMSVLVMLFCQLSAQNFTKTGIARLRLRNSGTIFQDDQVRGYYFFYNMEKKDRKNNNYLLSVYDENLREINSVEIVKPTSYALIDGAFNGEVFGFVFYDVKKKTAEFISYDKTLKQAGVSTKIITNKSSQATYTGMSQGAEANQTYLQPVSGKGFIYYGLQAGSKLQFEIDFYNNAMQKQWSKAAGKEAQSIETASEAFQGANYVGTLVTKRKSASSKNIDTDLLVQAVSDGKVQFRIPMETSQYTVSFSDVFYDSAKANLVVFGEYYNKGDKEMKSQSLGFIYLNIDINGKIISEKTSSWATDFAKVTPMNEKGKIDGSNTNILIHDIIRTADGQIFVVGEQYKKTVSGGGVALQALAIGLGAATGSYGGVNASTTQLSVYGMVIFEFNADYTIKGMHFFDKDKNNVLLPAGATYNSSKLLSYYAKAVGGFDYSFTQRSSDGNVFAVSYINYDREKGEGSRNVLGTIVYTPEKNFAFDRMVLNRKSTDYFVYRAKEGYVLITEYFKKEKRIESRLEKINY
jgi:hypothetical protein